MTIPEEDLTHLLASDVAHKAVELRSRELDDVARAYLKTARRAIEECLNEQH